MPFTATGHTLSLHNALPISAGGSFDSQNAIVAGTVKIFGNTRLSSFTNANTFDAPNGSITFTDNNYLIRVCTGAATTTFLSFILNYTGTETPNFIDTISGVG